MCQRTVCPQCFDAGKNCAGCADHIGDLVRDALLGGTRDMAFAGIQRHAAQLRTDGTVPIGGA